MNKLKLIIKREYLAKVRNKTFIVMTFLSPLLMIGMIALVAFLTKSSIEKSTNSINFAIIHCFRVCFFVLIAKNSNIKTM